MNKPLVNIIVPIYNVENYLEKCIDSILVQTYKNLKIILVNDGSTDSSGEICDRYAKKDDRVAVVHRKNGGISAARNSGLDFLEYKEERESYIAFVDPDDHVEPDYIYFLYCLIKDSNTDIAQCGHYIVFSDTRMVDKNRVHSTFLFNKQQALESLLTNGIYDLTLWNKLYKLNIFKSIRFPLGKTYEDTATCYLIAEKAEKFVVNMSPKYYYVQRYTSIANGTTFNEKKFDLVEAGDAMAKYIIKNYPFLSRAAYAKRVYVRLSTLSQMVNSNYYDKECISKMKRVIKKYRWNILFNKEVHMRDKIGVFILMFGYPAYYVIWKGYYNILRRKK